jgi:hypothetical protein
MTGSPFLGDIVFYCGTGRVKASREANDLPPLMQAPNCGSENPASLQPKKTAVPPMKPVCLARRNTFNCILCFLSLIFFHKVLPFLCHC